MPCKLLDYRGTDVQQVFDFGVQMETNMKGIGGVGWGGAGVGSQNLRGHRTIDESQNLKSGALLLSVFRARH